MAISSFHSFIIFTFLSCWFSILTQMLHAGETDKQGPSLSETEFFSSALNLDFPGLEKVKADVAAGDYTAAAADYLDFRRNKSKAIWHIDPRSKPTQAQAESDSAAEEVCNHIFGVGYPFTPQRAFVGEKINWTFNPLPPDDPAFTKEWTYAKINRMPYWDVLGTAYWKTLNEKYAREWVDQLVSWIQSNPVAVEANPIDTLQWRTLEAGVRIGNSWPMAYYRFLFSPNFTPTAHALYVRSVIDHAHRLIYGLNAPKRTGNWIAVECNGLAVCGILFPELKEAEKYREIAFDMINRQIVSQVYLDGAQQELSPGYHMLTLREFLKPMLLARRNGSPIPQPNLDIIRKMYHFIVDAMNQQWITPPHNDSEPIDVRADIATAVNIFPDDPVFQYVASGGKQGHPPETSKAFPYAGFYFMRGGWGPTDAYLRINSGPVGFGHQHEDKLSIIMNGLGRAFIIDPGNYIYDNSEWRHLVLVTDSHSTVMVDEKSQHRGGQLPEVDKPTGNPWMTSPLLDFTSGVYDDGYVASIYSPEHVLGFWGERDKSIAHTRSVFFLKPYYFLIVDQLTGSGSHFYESLFQLDAPGATIDSSTQTVYSKEDDDPNLALIPLDREKLSVKIIQGQTNPLRGWIPNGHKAIPMVVFSKKQEAPAVIATLLYPYRGNHPRLDLSSLSVKDSSIWARAFSTNFENVEVYVKTPQQKTLLLTKESHLSPLLNVDAQVLVIRQAIHEKAIYAAASGLTSVNLPEGCLEFAEPASLCWVGAKEGTLLFNAGDALATGMLQAPNKRIMLSLPPKKWMRLSEGQTVLSDDPELPFVKHH